MLFCELNRIVRSLFHRQTQPEFEKSNLDYETQRSRVNTFLENSLIERREKFQREVKKSLESNQPKTSDKTHEIHYHHRIVYSKQLSNDQNVKVQEIKRILALKKDKERDFKIFGVEKQVDVVELRRSYRQIIMLIHPDKLGALRSLPNADEAFKMVQESYDRLLHSENTS